MTRSEVEKKRDALADKEWPLPPNAALHIVTRKVNWTNGFDAAVELLWGEIEKLRGGTYLVQAGAKLHDESKLPGVRMFSYTGPTPTYIPPLDYQKLHEKIAVATEALEFYSQIGDEDDCVYHKHKQSDATGFQFIWSGVTQRAKEALQKIRGVG